MCWPQTLKPGKFGRALPSKRRHRKQPHALTTYLWLVFPGLGLTCPLREDSSVYSKKRTRRGWGSGEDEICSARITISAGDGPMKERRECHKKAAERTERQSGDDGRTRRRGHSSQKQFRTTPGTSPDVLIVFRSIKSIKQRRAQSIISTYIKRKRETSRQNQNRFGPREKFRFGANNLATAAGHVPKSEAAFENWRALKKLETL